ncbi:MAG: hypothetical protein JO199_01745, partial [Candidatus Eremiobacteraeota bacterium]|nr:hypothetical protein [Candidatus Eremiobacteraeota bacterium]
PEGLASGFKDFYGANLLNPTLRIVPWHVTSSIAAFMKHERSRMRNYEAFGSKAESYFGELERRLRAHAGEGVGLLPLNYLQFAYVGWSPKRS